MLKIRNLKHNLLYAYYRNITYLGFTIGDNILKLYCFFNRISYKELLEDNEFITLKKYKGC